MEIINSDVNQTILVGNRITSDCPLSSELKTFTRHVVSLEDFSF